MEMSVIEFSKQLEILKRPMNAYIIRDLLAIKGISDSVVFTKFIL